MRVQWTAGMRFKMAFETEDSSRTSWFMGTIAGVQVADPVQWPDSPWRLLQNVKRVNPWFVELVSNMPSIQMMPFSPQKKLRFPHHMDFPFESHTQFAALSGSGAFRPAASPLQCIMDHPPAGIQEARHGQIGFSLSNLHLNKLQLWLFQDTYQQNGCGSLPATTVSTDLFIGNSGVQDTVSCSLAIGIPPHSTQRRPAKGSQPRFSFLGSQYTLSQIRSWEFHWRRARATPKRIIAQLIKNQRN